MKEASFDALVERARQAAAGKDAKGATSALREAMVALWNTAPLYIEKALLVVSKAPGVGMYEPRPTNVYAQGEPILTYVEPGAYDFAFDDGACVIQLATDLAIIDSEGAVLTGKRDFGKFEFRTRMPITEMMMNLDLTINGIPAGEYTLEYVIRDIVSGGHEAKVRLPFVISA